MSRGSKRADEGRRPPAQRSKPERARQRQPSAGHRKTSAGRGERAPAGGPLRLGSPAATLALGRRLGRLLAPGDFVALSGELGAGKTLLVRGAAQGAGVPAEERASSPTFALVNLYRGGRVPLQHLDLYRLAGPADLFALGFDDLLAEPAATLCEWPERAVAALPAERLEIALAHAGPRARTAVVSAHGLRAEALRAALLRGSHRTRPGRRGGA